MKVGDRVSAIDEDITGHVIKIEGDLITIESDGFEMDFSHKELIVESEGLGHTLFKDSDVDEIIKQKESDDKPYKAQSKSHKEKYQHIMEVDLHAHQLARSTQGMTKHQILNLQIDTIKYKIDFAIKKNIQKVVFIHGVGEGVLKIELDYLLSTYDNLKFYDADFKKYGYGATEIFIFQNSN